MDSTMLDSMQNSSIGLEYAPFNSNSRGSMSTPSEPSAVNTPSVRKSSSEERSEGLEAGEVAYSHKAFKNGLGGVFGSMNLFVPGGIIIENLRKFSSRYYFYLNFSFQFNHGIFKFF